MCELYGRDNLESFNDLILGGKSLDQIREYSAVFWKKFKQIDNYQKYIERIEKGESEIAKLKSINVAIHDKFAKLIDAFQEKNPSKTFKDFSFADIAIDYQGQEVTPDDLALNPFNFSLDEDRIYAMCLFKYTYGYWEITRNELRNHPTMLFNWAVQTRSVQDIAKRSEHLVHLFKQELYGEQTEEPAQNATKAN